MNDKYARQAKLPRGAYQKTLGEAISPFVAGSQSTPTDKLSWHALRVGCCAKCGNIFKEGLTISIFSDNTRMFIHQCGFKIREGKYNAITGTQLGGEEHDK